MKSKRNSLSLLKSPLIAVFLVLVIIAIYTNAALPTGIINLPFLRHTKSKFQDCYFKARLFYNERFRKDYPKESAVVLVAIDDETTLNPLLNVYTTTGMMARAVESISACNPKVIIYDQAILNEEVLDKTLENDRDLLIETIKKSGNVLMACDPEEKSLCQIDRDILKAGLDYGRTDVIVSDYDNIARYLIPPGLEEEGQIKKIALPIKAALLYRGTSINTFSLNKDKTKVFFASETDLITVPLNGDNHIPINYLYNKEMIPTVPICKFLQEDFKAEHLQGKIALITETRTKSPDRHNTPIGKMPGGLILANIVNSFVYTCFLVEVPIRLHFLILVFLSTFLAILFYKNNMVSGIILLLLTICSSVVMSFILFLNNILWFAFDLIVLSSLLFIAITYHKLLIFEIGCQS